MRPLLLCLTLLFLSMGCSKNNHHCDPAMMNTMIGKWKLVISTGGIAGQTVYPPVDSNYTLILNNDSTYLRHINGFSDSGTFTVIQVKSEPNWNSVLGPGIVFSKGPSWPMLYHLGMDSLVLSDYISDGYTSVYLRVD